MNEAISNKEKDLLRGLADTYAKCAADPVNVERSSLWTQLNELKPTRPMVYINELPWNEMNIDGELDAECESNWAKGQEKWLKRQIYLWKHMPGDMVLSQDRPSPKVYHSTGFGIREDVDIQKTDNDNSVVSRHFKPQLTEEEDLDKIKPAVVTFDEEATQKNFELSSEVFGNILPVKITGRKHTWFTPWDNFVRWTGIEEAMMDLYVRPEFINEAIQRMVASCMEEMRQLVEMGLLDRDDDNSRVGSGGYGFCKPLGSVSESGIITPDQTWGCSNAQIFSEVSPEMHWEFALRHDLPWLEQFGLNYYGCCEPLHNKIEIIRRIPNLRKVSVSPWCDAKKMADEMGNEVVLSVKPSPAIFASDIWNPTQARSEIRTLLEKTRGCSVELIMKDVSTIRRDPHRLFEWAQIAKEEVEAFSLQAV